MFGAAELEYAARMVLAAVCGILIGYERKNRAKEAGVRTHCVVACASALMMVLSKYAYADVLGEFVKLDPSRVASGVVSGIGFLGAGMILVHKKTVTGLTTAAGLWATSGIGMAIGAGMYVVGISAALIILLIQVILHMTPRNQAAGRPHGDSGAEGEENGSLLAALEGRDLRILAAQQSTEERDGQIVYTITVSVPQKQAVPKGESAGKRGERMP